MGVCVKASSWLCLDAIVSQVHLPACLNELISQYLRGQVD